MDQAQTAQAQPGQGEVAKLRAELASAKLPPALKEKAENLIMRIELTFKYGGNFSQIDIADKYIEWISNLPWETKTNDILDIGKAKVVLDKNHFGLEKIKQRVLEYLSIIIMQRQQAAVSLHTPILFFVGLAGTGKTTFAMSIAEALGRKFVRIPFGGISSPYDLRGQSKISPEAEPGLIIRALRKSGVKNPVILLDELDRIAPETRSAIMGVLIELLDAEQQNSFNDYYVDYPFDLSQVLFIATANNTNSLSTAVLDRMELVQMPSYTDAEKIAIGKNYILPKYLADSGLPKGSLTIDDNTWGKITRPLGFDAGIRTLERTIDMIIRRCAFKMVNNQGKSFAINEENLREFIA